MKRKSSEGFKVPLNKPKLSSLPFNMEAALKRKERSLSGAPEDELRRFSSLFERSTFDELKRAGFNSNYSNFLDYLNYAKLIQQADSDFDGPSSPSVAVDQLRQSTMFKHSISRGRQFDHEAELAYRKAAVTYSTTRSSSPMSIASVKTIDIPPPRYSALLTTHLY
jgi:hypothetical protein